MPRTIGYVLPHTQVIVPVSTSRVWHSLQSVGLTSLAERFRRAQVLEHLTSRRESLKGTFFSTASFTLRLARPQLHCSRSINLYFIERSLLAPEVCPDGHPHKVL